MSSDETTPPPDPRWPSKCRWSVKYTSPSESTKATQCVVTDDNLGEALSLKNTTLQSAISSPVVPENQIEKSLEILSASKDIAERSSSPLPVVVGVLPDGKECLTTTLSVPLSETESLSTSSLQGAWVKTINIKPGLSSIFSPELWPSLMDSQKGKEVRQQRKEVPINKTFKEVTQTVQAPSGKKEDDLRFPWAAKMNPASRNLYRATEPEYLEDGTPKKQDTEGGRESPENSRVNQSAELNEQQLASKISTVYAGTPFSKRNR